MAEAQAAQARDQQAAATTTAPAQQAAPAPAAPAPTPAAPRTPAVKSFDQWESTYKGDPIDPATYSAGLPQHLLNGGAAGLIDNPNITDPMGYTVRPHGTGFMLDFGNGVEIWSDVRNPASGENDARTIATQIQKYRTDKAAAEKAAAEMGYDAKYNAYRDYVTGLGANFADYDPGGVRGTYGTAKDRLFRNDAERLTAEKALYDTAVSGAQDFQTWLGSQGDAAPATFNDQRAAYQSYLGGIYGNAPTGVTAKSYDSLLPGVASDYGNLAGTYFESAAARDAAERAAYQQNVSSLPDFYTWYNSQGMGNPQQALQEYSQLVTNTFGNAPGSVSQPANAQPYLSEAQRLSDYYGYLDNLGINTSNMDRNELQQAYGLAQNVERKNAAIADVQGQLESAKGQYDTLFGNYNTTLSDLTAVQNQLQDLQGSYNTITGDYGSLQDTYNQLQNQYGNLQQDLTSYSNQMDQLQGTYDNLLGDYNTLVGENQQLFSNLGTTQNALSGLQSNFTDLQAKYGDLTQQFDAVTGELTGLKDQYGNVVGKYDALTGQFTDLQNLYTSLGDQLSTLQTDYAGLQNKYGALTEQYDATTGELTGLKDQYGNLVGQYDALTGQMTDLQGAYDLLGNQYSGLQSNFTDLQNKYGALTEQYDATTGELTGLRDQYGNLVGQYDALTGQFTDLQQNYSGLQDQFAGLQTDYSGLQSQYGDLAGQYDVLQGQYGTTLSALEQQKQQYAAAQDEIQRRYVEKLQDEAAANFAKEQARKQAIIESAQYTPVAAIQQRPALDPNSYNAPVIDYNATLSAAAPNLTQPINLTMPEVDFVSMYAPVPLAPQMQQASPQLDFTAPFQPYLQAVQQQYGANTPTAYTGIMGGTRTS